MVNSVRTTTTRSVTLTVAVAAVVATSTVNAVDSQRNFKKGIAGHKVQSCDAFEPHETSSWWYSWGLDDGFGYSPSLPMSRHKGSFCPAEEAKKAVARARAKGMDFVPMLYHSVPERPLDAQVHLNLVEADYLLTINEPELASSYVEPKAVAEMWPAVLELAADYDLQVVGPCSEMGHFGMTWWDLWTEECKAMYGAPCEYDFICNHMYFQPYPCAEGVTWACIGPGGGAANGVIQSWYNKYGQKPLWVTEFACAPWGGAECTEERHAEVMKQLGEVFEASDLVFRYSWYKMYSFEWKVNSLNQLLWEGTANGQACPNRKWLAAWGNKKTKIQTLDQCVAKAEANDICFKPLSLSIDDDACYCAKDDCAETVTAWSSMVTYKNVGDSGPKPKKDIFSMLKSLITGEEPLAKANLTTMGLEYEIMGLDLDDPDSEQIVKKMAREVGSSAKSFMNYFHYYSSMVY